MRRTTNGVAPIGSRGAGVSRAHVDDGWKALAAVLDLIKNVEAKATVTLASTTAIGGLLLNAVKGQSFDPAVQAVPVLLSAASAVISAIAAAMTLWPRLYTKDCVRSELFFGHLDRRFDIADAFTERALHLLGDDRRMARELAGQIWSVSCVARRKYRWGRVAVMCALLALANLAITVLTLAF